MASRIWTPYYMWKSYDNIIVPIRQIQHMPTLHIHTCQCLYRSNCNISKNNKKDPKTEYTPHFKYPYIEVLAIHARNQIRWALDQPIISTWRTYSRWPVFTPHAIQVLAVWNFLPRWKSILISIVLLAYSTHNSQKFTSNNFTSLSVSSLFYKNPIKSNFMVLLSHIGIYMCT